MFKFLSIAHSLKKLALSNASPPDITTWRVPNLFNESNSPEISASVSCFRFLLSFHISHITQRQLQALCGINITIGKAVTLWVCKVLYRLYVCCNDCAIICYLCFTITQ